MQPQPRIVGGERHLYLHELIHVQADDGRQDWPAPDEVMNLCAEGRQNRVIRIGSLVAAQEQYPS